MLMPSTCAFFVLPLARSVVGLCTNVLVGGPTSQARRSREDRGGTPAGVPRCLSAERRRVPSARRSAPRPPVLLVDLTAPGAEDGFVRPHGRRCQPFGGGGL